MRKILFITLLITIFLSYFEANGADWKFSGGTTIADEEMITFYDAESLQYSLAGTVKVWVKAVGQSEFNTQMKKNEKQIIKQSAEKLVNGYAPPFSLANKKTRFEDSVEIVSWEELVNSFEVKPRAKFLFEINCTDNKIRTLSGTIFNHEGEVKSSKKFDVWDYISPESNGETLKKILCK